MKEHPDVLLAVLALGLLELAALGVLVFLASLVRDGARALNHALAAVREAEEALRATAPAELARSTSVLERLLEALHPDEVFAWRTKLEAHDSALADHRARIEALETWRRAVKWLPEAAEGGGQ